MLAQPAIRSLELANGLTIAARHWQPTSMTPSRFLLIHGLASNAQVWDEVGRLLAEAGHEAVAYDQRGHGFSSEPTDGYDTPTCASDAADVLDALGWASEETLVIGQSWGAHVALALAHSHPVRAVGLVDGGWIRLSTAFPDFDECWKQLAPPDFSNMRYSTLASAITAMNPNWPEASLRGTLNNLMELPEGGVRARLKREYHRSILHSMFSDDPSQWFIQAAPTLLMPAAHPEPQPQEPERTTATRALILDCLATLPQGDISWYPGGHHDLHAEQPEAVVADLLHLAHRSTN